MHPEKKIHPEEKTSLHPRNKHRERYDFKKLCASVPELAKYVKVNDYEDESIDFFDPLAVKMLNKALLKHFYGIHFWDIPETYLCPPVPGRADYIHHAAELLGSCDQGKIPEGSLVKCLDIGAGASCIYPLIGNKEYGWSFTASEIDPIAIKAAKKIIEMNHLNGKIEMRFQENQKDIYKGIIRENELFDLSICNPPFNASLSESRTGALRKLHNLKRNTRVPVLNFGGQNAELWCDGGEEKFIGKMIHESKYYAKSCLWFTTLVSKKSNMYGVQKALGKVQAAEIKIIPMAQGNKTGRIVAWTFFNKEDQEKWVATRWNSPLA